MKRETLNHIPADILAPDDYMRLAPDFIDDPVWAYIEGAAGFEITASRNRAAFNEVRLTTRVLQDFSTASTACSLLGQNFKHPVFLAPVAHQQLVHGDGEKASIAGAGAVDACFVASTLSSFTLEDIAAAGAGPKWFQLYFQLARDSTRDLVQRAQAAGYSALVVTVDVPVTAMRYRQQRAGFNLSVVEANLVAYPRIAPRTLTRNQSPVLDGFMADAPTWQDIAWLRSVTDLPLLIKGITHPLDVRQAIALGVDGVIVSNHGGRSVDGLPATLELLPLTREAAGNRIALLMDGGIRSGSDVFKALALGADAVLVGRLQPCALAVAGALGVAHMLQCLRQELEVTMALTGCRTLAEITRACLFNLCHTQDQQC